MNKKKNTKSILNIFSKSDLKAFELFLEKKAKQGYLITEVSTMLTFKKVKPFNAKFSIKAYKKDGVLQNGASLSLKDYYKLCSESGYIYATTFNNMHIFYTKSDEFQPLMSDAFLEYKTITKSVAKNLLILSLLLLPLILSNIIDVFNTSYAQLLKNKDIVFLASSTIITILFIFYIVKDITWLIKASIYMKKNINVLNRKKFHTNYKYFFIVFVIIIALINIVFSNFIENKQNTLKYNDVNIITLKDLDYQEEVEDVIPFKSNSSIFVPNSYSYMQKSKKDDEPYLYIKYYNTKNQNIANSITNSEIKNAKKGGLSTLKADKNNSFNNSEVYYIHNNTVLINNKNNIYIIKSSFDLKDQKTSSIIQQKLLL